MRKREATFSFPSFRLELKRKRSGWQARVTLLYLWPFFTCDASPLVTLLHLWRFSTCDSSSLVTLLYLWCFSTCDASSLVTLLHLWRFFTCDPSPLVTLFHSWRFSTCDASLSVTFLHLWRFFTCDTSLLVTLLHLWRFFTCALLHLWRFFTCDTSSLVTLLYLWRFSILPPSHWKICIRPAGLWLPRVRWLSAFDFLSVCSSSSVLSRFCATRSKLIVSDTRIESHHPFSIYGTVTSSHHLSPPISRLFHTFCLSCDSFS